MLASTHSEDSVNPPETEPLQIKLPPDLECFFNESGYLPTTAAEYRGNARLRVRSKATLQVATTPKAVLESNVKAFHPGEILIKDLSRSGVGFLYHREIYPTQQIKIRFQGRLIDAIVVRCRRLGELCYEIGGRVSETKTIISD